MSGLYIAFIGPSGNGKDTQIELLKLYLSQRYPEFTQEDIDFTREPGGTLYADDIAERLKYWALTPEKEMQDFAMARANSLANRVGPNLELGKLEVSNRCFLDSLAYQGFGRGLGLETVWNHNKEIVKNLVPEIVVFLDIGLEVALKRSRGDRPDKFDKEAPSFWRNVYQGYEETLVWLQKNFPETGIIRIKDKLGHMTPKETSEALLYHLSPHIEAWAETRNRSIVREVAR